MTNSHHKTYSQAERVIYAFGGARKLATLFEAVGSPRCANGIQRWTYPKTRGGSGGFIPSSVWPELFEIAKEFGVELTSELVDPHPRPLMLDGQVVLIDRESLL